MRIRTLVLLTTALAGLATAAAAGQNQHAASTGYLEPPKVIVDILDAQPLPVALVSPARTSMALLERPSLPSIADLAQPMLRLAGYRINPRTNGPHRTSWTTGIALKPVAGGPERRIDVPAGARVSWVKFSPDGARLAFGVTAEGGSDLWIADAGTALARRIPAVKLNEIGNSGCDWLRDGRTLLCQLVPAGRGRPPTAPGVPSGPSIQENLGQTAPVRTYQDLLASAHDEHLFEHYFTSQIAIVDAASGQATSIGRPGLFLRVSPSTDGEYVLVSRLKRPFSRLVPAGDFPQDVQILNRRGEVVRTIADVPLADIVPINGVITGPRAFRWNPTEPAALVYAEALDEGNPRNEVPHRDRLFVLEAPFTGKPAELMKTEYRYSGIAWTDSGTALVTEYDRPTRWRRTWVIDGAGAPRKLWDLNAQDRYNDPGSPVSLPGRDTILQHGGAIYLTGAGASPQGDRPFLDRLDLASFATERLFRSDESSYETVVALLTDDATSLLTRHESRTEPPNYFVVTAGQPGPPQRGRMTARRTEGITRQPVTAFVDPAPQISGADRQLVTYARSDGVQLYGTIYLPPGHGEGEPLPMVVWAYPREFTDPDSAGQVTGSPNRFTTVSGASHLLLLTQGYAIFDGPAMPIVGPGETANDTYVEQLVASAQAAVDKTVGMGVADPDRIGVGGHSYGAFMTANLLAHSDIFRAGIARSGAYNRTLTPFGFQNEIRTFWEAPDVYARMSPFWYAHRINEPILLIHGEADNNSGTFPIQSERLYMALKGHGAVVRYVTLPHESHGYAARESVLHAVAEMLNWMDTYVKGAPPRTPTTASGGGRF